MSAAKRLKFLQPVLFPRGKVLIQFPYKSLWGQEKATIVLRQEVHPNFVTCVSAYRSCESIVSASDNLYQTCFPQLLFYFSYPSTSATFLLQLPFYFSYPSTSATLLLQLPFYFSYPSTSATLLLQLPFYFSYPSTSATLLLQLPFYFSYPSTSATLLLQVFLESFHGY